MRAKNCCGGASLLVLIAIYALAISGCATGQASKLSGPAPIHQSEQEDPSAISGETGKEAYQAYLDQALSYYKSMKAAKAAPSDSAKIESYVRSGITLVDTSCRHWFNSVANAQRKLELTESNTNILYQLGTALIGIARAHSDVTAVYGALTSGYISATKNIGAALSVAPNAENVKQLTFDALHQRAAKLTGGNSTEKPSNYDDAFNALDAYADICTFSEIKRLANGAVTGSEAKDENGQIFVVPKSTAGLKGQATALFDPVKALINSVDSLNFSQALALANTMPYQTDPRVATSINQMDPNGKRRTDIAVAKAIAKMAITGTATTLAEIQKWQDAIKKVQ